MKTVKFEFEQSHWRLHVVIGDRDTNKESWIGVIGPEGQMAAFECPSDSVRAEVLNALADELIASPAVRDAR